MIWATLALLLVKGLGSVVTPPAARVTTPRGQVTAGDPATEAFAVRFARSYLADPSGADLAPFMAEGARIATGRPPVEANATVAQAEVSSVDETGAGTAVVTVACVLGDGRTLYLAVPTIGSNSGEVAATGAPWLVAAPGTAGAGEAGRPQTLAGADGPAIESLVSKFLPLYLAASSAGELSYLLLPGAVIQPLDGQVALKSLAGVTQLGDGEGPRRTVLAGARVTDPTGGATWPLVYRLELRRAGEAGRWYVADVEGVSS